MVLFCIVNSTVKADVDKKQKRAELGWALAKSKDVEEEKDLIQLKREDRLKGGFYANPEAKPLFIIRISLVPIFNGIFLKLNKATVNMLHKVEPYVTYGYDNN
ncbi:60S ribosomal protein L7-4 [Striga hermonthica]|uniref:60S ribosomal protein L7-4 n=1 Tax=Striga hermonthica TaxID=68872 RepID=A0A9N7RJW4_STRHE|nr:60S ribosomal protein L7-4 [Striga hermonthica]